MQALARIARPVLTFKALPIRTFTTLSPLRPSLSRPPTAPLRFTPTGVVDVVAPGSISAHPALAGGAAQIRCGPRNTMNGATRLVQKRRHGYLGRTRTRTGRAILKRRRQKRRAKLGCH
ncbi:Ribosomal protein L34 [Cordyceps fumosorosea ARSEF 2679]|uniref:Ribosomal protein L34 n=1 Tax=Cordyceps fumosorosea (strain ARSEF 2679) TaxID=1081104 RepID=A0A167P8K1_CORFA|nr:Ribosomal protein L34 [Cordyceps fumosorosea ARSEF 2679]OAA56396.1 Ribosomal protein L34 [Cordyceps fumosorosea ARSEF 2679]